MIIFHLLIQVIDAPQVTAKPVPAAVTCLVGHVLQGFERFQMQNAGGNVGPNLPSAAAGGRIAASQSRKAFTA
jgi:hypothetical protein